MDSVTDKLLNDFKNLPTQNQLYNTTRVMSKANCMVSYLYNQYYDTLEAPSETIDAALCSKDEAWDKVGTLQKQIKGLKAELVASKKSSDEAKREFVDKLEAFEDAKNKAIAEKNGVIDEVARLVAENKKLASDLAESKSSASDYYQQLFNLQQLYGDKNAKVVSLRAIVREAKRRCGVDLLETSLNLVTMMYQADPDRDFSFLPKQYQTEIARLKCEAAGDTFVYPEDNEPKAEDLETDEPEAEELNSKSSESRKDMDDNDNKAPTTTFSQPEGAVPPA